MSYKHCKVCGEMFYSRPDNDRNKTRGKYCSRKCYSVDKRSKWQEYTCDHCWKKFRIPLWRERTKPMKHHFCSTKCFFEYKRSHPDQFVVGSNRKGIFKVALDVTEKVLREEYLEERLTIREIAARHHCSYSAVNARLRSFKIPTRRAKDYTTGDSEAYWSFMVQRDVI